MIKMSPRQASIAYYARAVIEWRAKGWDERSVNRMLIGCLECTRSVHSDPAGDAVIVLEIADGKRVA